MSALRTVRLVFVALFALLTLVVATPAQAASDAFHYSFSGPTARIDSYQFDGCASKYLSLTINQSILKSGGEKSTYSYVTGIYEVWDSCSGVYFAVPLDSSLPPGALQIDNRLNSATLQASIQAYDYYSGNYIPVTLNLSWAATGDITRVRSQYQYTSPTFTVMDVVNSLNRTAAVSGTVGISSTSIELVGALGELRDGKTSTTVIYRS